MSTIPLRERKKTATREAIAACAHRLFTERGYEATTIDDITAAAVVSRRTFFRYFATKEDLLFTDEGDLRDVLRAGILAAPADLSPLAAAEHAAGYLADRLEGRREEFLAHQRLVGTTPALVQRDQNKHLAWQDMLVGCLRDRGTDADDAALVARVATACFDLALQHWLAIGDPPLRHRISDNFTRVRAIVTR